MLDTVDLKILQLKYCLIKRLKYGYKDQIKQLVKSFLLPTLQPKWHATRHTLAN
jgi:hypothetical protein